MNETVRLVIFGEVLFDCFPTGEQVLGGAPFNVAWHAQALGDRPLLISRVGADASGAAILDAMRDWGMETTGVQQDQSHPTGSVTVTFAGQEPVYRIESERAYDYIAVAQLPTLTEAGILYHGTLALRHAESRAALARLTQQREVDLFLDVNLRDPWWARDQVLAWLERARWAKLNQNELAMLGFEAAEPTVGMAQLQNRCAMEQLILTRGELGALVRTEDGTLHQVRPEPVNRFVDTVGAGDAFSAMYLHGLLAGWPIVENLTRAQRFAGRQIGCRGATSSDRDFYRGELIDATHGGEA